MGFGSRQRTNETLSEALRERIKQRQQELPENEVNVCSISSDCPPGHLCVNGRCVKLSTAS